MLHRALVLPLIKLAQAGGTCSFYDLALITWTTRGRVNNDAASLGDRVAIQELAIRDNQVVVTMAACPEDSLEDRFVRDLVGAAGWFLRGGDLYIDLRYDTGTMRFEQ